MNSVLALLAEASVDSSSLKGWLTLIPAIITAVAGIAGLLGLTKYLIEPFYVAKSLRKKYAVALWIACSELESQLKRILQQVRAGDQGTIDALKKIPNNDAKGGGDRIRSDWFTKEGYYTTFTAYKIAAVAAWLQIYQRELLFLPYSVSQKFLATLYAHADKVKIAFSEDTCLWYEYFNAVGDRLVAKSPSEPAGAALIPMSFSEFCSHYATDEQFRLFFDQLHMYIWFFADRRERSLHSVEQVVKALQGLKAHLLKQKLVSHKFVVNRPDIHSNLVVRTGQPPG